MTALTILVFVAGWGGAAVLLAAYGLSSTGRLPSASIRDQVLNVLGAAALIVQCLYQQAWPMLMLNAVWFGFGLATLLVALRRERHPSVVSDLVIAEDS